MLEDLRESEVVKIEDVLGLMPDFAVIDELQVNLRLSSSIKLAHKSFHSA